MANSVIWNNVNAWLAIFILSYFFPRHYTTRKKKNPYFWVSNNSILYVTVTHLDFAEWKRLVKLCNIQMLSSCINIMLRAWNTKSIFLLQKKKFLLQNCTWTKSSLLSSDLMSLSMSYNFIKRYFSEKSFHALQGFNNGGISYCCCDCLVSIRFLIINWVMHSFHNVARSCT